MNYSELKDIATSKRIQIKDIASDLDMTPDGFRISIKNETIPLRNLKILCDRLRINPMLFFDIAPGAYINSAGHTQVGNGNKMNIDSKNREIELLKQQLEDKNEIIRLLKQAK